MTFLKVSIKPLATTIAYATRLKSNIAGAADTEVTVRFRDRITDACPVINSKEFTTTVPVSTVKTY